MRNLIIYFSLIFFVSCFGTKDNRQNSASGVALDGYLYLAQLLLILMEMEFKMVMSHLVQRMQMVIMQSHQILIFQVLEL